MITHQIATETEVRDPWSSWARVVDLPAAEADPDAVVEQPPEHPPVSQQPPEHPPASEQPPDPEVSATAVPDLAAVVAQLAAELADERRQRAAADEARRDTEARLHDAELTAARAGAEVTAAQARIVELERDRDDVIRRAEELLTAVRERADQRLASELESASRHWSELLAQERVRVEALDRERAGLAQRVQDAWLAAAVLRRSRPLRPRSSMPTTADAAGAEVLEALDESETDPTLAADSPQLADEIEQLRQRLRGQLHKPAEIDEVEDGVEDLRVLRLARDEESSGHRKK